MNYQGGKKPLPYSLMESVKRYFPLIKKYENHDGLLYASIPSVREDGDLFYYKVDDVLGNDLKKLDDKIAAGTVSFGKRKFSFGKNLKSFKKIKSKLKTLKKDLNKIPKF